MYVLLLLLLLEGYLHTHRRTMMSGTNESEQQMQQSHRSYTKALTRKHRHKSIRIDDLLVWRVRFVVVVFVIRINISMHVCVF